MVVIIDSFRDEFVELQKRLEVFLNLEIGDKILKGEDGFLDKDPPSNFQFLRRWWYGESREKTLEYLDTLFQDFFKFLDKILAFIRTHMFSQVIEKLSVDVCNYITKIMEGLHKLKQTYYNDTKIVCKVDACILTMIDFKDETSTFRIQKYKKTIVRCNSFNQIAPDSLSI
tara:strand:+ start:1731 stop:2243 length:513 start_codon:yes stop_codon:yes gene_type:complete